MKGPRLIVRAIVIEDGRLLVNRRRDRLTLFGGRVEKGELARDALTRELDEELGLKSTIGPLAYLIENRYDGKHELGLYYVVTPLSPFSAREDHLDPFWFPLAEVGASSLLPAPLRRELATRGVPDHPIEVS